MVNCRCRCPDCKSEFMQKYQSEKDLPPITSSHGKVTIYRVKCWRCTGLKAGGFFKGWLEKQKAEEKFLPTTSGKR